MEILNSKKFQGLLVGVAVTIAADQGLDLDRETIFALVGLFATYIGGQAVADIGKEKAIAEAAIEDIKNGKNQE